MSSYPTKFTDANLINIQYLKKKYNVSTGYSDHVPGINASINAAILGAEIIEKHFMPKKTKLAGDYSLSIDKHELKKMIEKIKQSLKMLGSIRRKEFKSELLFKKTLRRSLYFSKNIKKGKKITHNDLIMLRPFNLKGIKIENYKKINGHTLKYDVKKHQLVKKKYIINEKNKMLHRSKNGF